MVDWLRLGADAEELGTRTLQGAKRMGGLLRPLTIRPYRGWVAEGVAHVRARVLEEPRFEAAAEGLRIDSTIYANLTRWVVLDMPGIDVTVSLGGASVTERSNQDGFVIAKIPVGDLPPGWHTVDFRADDQQGGEVQVHGRVVQPDPASGVAVISDIDDTILRTGMTEGLRSIQRTILRDAHGRKPIPGMPSLYRGLARGNSRRPESTFFYVSSSPWNLYDMLVHFLAIRGFPRGPLLLTDWRPGPIPTTTAKETTGHKRTRIRRIFDSYPDLRWVLIGDDGEADPEIYTEFLKTDRARIDAAFLRSVRGADNSKGAAGSWLSPASRRASPPITCTDALAMARAAERMGLVDGFTVEEVMSELGVRI